MATSTLEMLHESEPSAGGRRTFVAFVGPNWFAAVMGTGIVANAAATLPVAVPGLLLLARGVWLLDVGLLVLVSLLTAAHWRWHGPVARSHLRHPVMSQFYGAPAMALMTVGAGALLVGVPVLGQHGAVVLDAVLWTSGTLLGLVTAVAIPYRVFTSQGVEADAAFGGWLMPVVPPMVSAATGPLLVPHLPVGQWRESLQLACTSMFGLALVASLIVIAQIWARLAHHGIGPAASVPTLWIVLGPLGQSITAAHTLGATAGSALPAPYAAGFRVMAVVYGVPMWGFAMLWVALAASVTLSSARQGLPFSLTWWSFTFPVGTLVTGTAGLAVDTQSVVLRVAAVVLYAGLMAAWAVVATRTVRGARQLLAPPVENPTG